MRAKRDERSSLAAQSSVMTLDTQARSGTRGMNGKIKMPMEKTLCVTSLIQFSRLVNQSAPSA